MIWRTMAKAKKVPMAKAESVFHIEDVFPLIRQKGDLIKVSMTCRFEKKTWDDLGGVIGKMARVAIVETDDYEEGEESEELPFEEGDE